MTTLARIAVLTFVVGDADSGIGDSAGDDGDDRMVVRVKRLIYAINKVACFVCCDT